VVSTEVASESRVTFSVSDGLAHMRLSRPDGHNAIDSEMVRALASAVADLDTAEDLRGVLVDALGPHFTVGADVKSLARSADQLVDELRSSVSVYHGALEVLRALDIPVVCAAQGIAAGGGLGLLWCADIVIAASDLQLEAGFATIGLTPEGGSSWVLPRLVGEQRARSMMMLGRTVNAEEALEWGVVDRVVAPQRLHDEAQAVARAMASGPTTAYCHLKRLLRTGAQAGWSDQLAAERITLMICAASGDAAEGVTSAAEGRPPKFTGR
jgi:2-(1,2-epoxy-1,2-dihydrophenyl)acetyl-CoA isomerase